jgi:hypothetical protein
LWIDKARAVYNDIRGGSYKEGQEQLQLAYRNMDCLQAPYRYYTNPSRLKIDGTICKSGDVLVRAVDELQRQAVYFLPVSTIQSRIEAASPSAAAPAAASGWGSPLPAAPAAPLVRAAYTTGFAPRFDAAVPPPRLQLAQYHVQVLWSQLMPGNPRYLVQRIRRPDGCFDQIIDLANGTVVQVRRAPC